MVNLKNEKYTSVINDIISNIIEKKTIEFNVIESFTKYIDANDTNQLELIEKLIHNFFINNKDSNVIFYEKIGKKLESLNIEQMNNQEKIIFEIFSNELILSIQEKLIKLQNDGLRIENDKMIIYLHAPQMFDELITLTDILSNDEKLLSEDSQRKLSELKKQITFFEDMKAKRITIKDFANKYDFNFSQQTPNVPEP